MLSGHGRESETARESHCGAKVSPRGVLGQCGFGTFLRKTANYLIHSRNFT